MLDLAVASGVRYVRNIRKTPMRRGLQRLASIRVGRPSRLDFWSDTDAYTVLRTVHTLCTTYYVYRKCIRPRRIALCRRCDSLDSIN
jgi:hypothetical protein